MKGYVVELARWNAKETETLRNKPARASFRPTNKAPTMVGFTAISPAMRQASNLNPVLVQMPLPIQAPVHHLNLEHTVPRRAHILLNDGLEVLVIITQVL